MTGPEGSELLGGYVSGIKLVEDVRSPPAALRPPTGRRSGMYDRPRDETPDHGERQRGDVQVLVLAMDPQLDRLHKVAHAIRERLAVVLVDGSPSIEELKPVENLPESTELGRQIATQITRISGLNALLQDMLERLAL